MISPQYDYTKLDKILSNINIDNYINVFNSIDESILNFFHEKFKYDYGSDHLEKWEQLYELLSYILFPNPDFNTDRYKGIEILIAMKSYINKTKRIRSMIEYYLIKNMMIDNDKKITKNY